MKGVDMRFFSVVLVHMLLQVGVMYGVAKNESPFHNVINRTYLVLGEIGILGLMVLLGLYPLKNGYVNISVKAVLFTIFSVVIGLILNGLKGIDKAIIEVGKTFFLLLLFGILSIFMGINVGGTEDKLYDWYYLSLFGIIASIAMSMYLSKKDMTTFIGGLISIFIVLRTNSILRREYGDFVDASLAYFIDVTDLMRLQLNENYINRFTW